MTPEGRMPSGREVVNRYTAKLSELSVRYPEVKTDAELLKERAEELKRERQKSAGILENTTFGGKVGSFTGAMAASMTDPRVLATIPRGASVSAGVIRTFLIEGGMAAASATLLQPFVFRYKQKIESPYGLGDAATRIALSGIGGGAIAGTLKAAGKLLFRPRVDGIDDLLEIFERHSSRATQTETDAAHMLGGLCRYAQRDAFRAWSAGSR